jgi:hypothetical protein
MHYDMSHLNHYTTVKPFCAYESLYTKKMRLYHTKIKMVNDDEDDRVISNTHRSKNTVPA